MVYTTIYPFGFVVHELSSPLKSTRTDSFTESRKLPAHSFGSSMLDTSRAVFRDGGGGGGHCPDLKKDFFFSAVDTGLSGDPLTPVPSWSRGNFYVTMGFNELFCRREEISPWLRSTRS
jgi:hypothetical protein